VSHRERSLGVATMWALLASQAERRGQAVAVTGSGVSLRYDQLLAEADLLATRLAAAGVRRGDVVALACGDHPDAVVGMAAAASCAAAFLPLDADLPPSRVQRILAKAKVRAAVVPAARTPAPELPDTIERVPVDRVRDQAQPRSARCEARPGDPAYIVFTSGSTGEPKGVVVSHAAFAAHIAAVVALLGVRDDSVLLQYASVGFDMSLDDIWAALAAGARVAMHGRALWSLPELLETTSTERISIWHLPTAYWSYLAADLAGRPELTIPASLETVAIGGEAASTTAARAWADSPFGKLRLINRYGPTEGVVAATAWELRGAPPQVRYLPIGSAIPGHGTAVLNERGAPVPPETVGELYLTGACIADGYIADPEASAKVFVTLPSGRPAVRTGDLVVQDADGVLHFRGRRDRQVKVSGLRVEPDEIEAALLAIPGITAAAVVTADGELSCRLIAHLVSAVPGEQVEPLANRVRAALRAEFPAGMIPSAFRLHDRLPLTTHGKVDHAALRKYGATRTGAAMTVDPADTSKAQAQGVGSHQLAADGSSDRVTRLLEQIEALADDVGAGDGQAVRHFGEALGFVLADSGAAPDPSWFAAPPAAESAGLLRLEPAAAQRLTAMLGQLTNPAHLSAAVRALLDAGVCLQQVEGGAGAAEDMVACASALVPVLEAVGAGLHPLVGVGAMAAVDCQENDAGTAFSALTSRLEALAGPTRGEALRDLTALSETLLTQPANREAGRWLLTILTAAAQTPASSSTAPSNREDQ
jgi:amino acid adenylation domain-containing protein